MRLQVEGMLSILVSADGRSHRYIIKVSLSMVTACTEQQCDELTFLFIESSFIIIGVLRSMKPGSKNKRSFKLFSRHD
jgi:hypothetical protein